MRERERQRERERERKKKREREKEREREQRKRELLDAQNGCALLWNESSMRNSSDLVHYIM